MRRDSVKVMHLFGKSGRAFFPFRNNLLTLPLPRELGLRGTKRKYMEKILLLGSGELGKELVIAAKRMGLYVVACDSYAGAPAMQVADEAEVFNMLDGEALESVAHKHRPDYIVPEIEAIRTEELYKLECEGMRVVPSARAVNCTMNRKAIRELAARELGLRTARYRYVQTFDALREAAAELGFPCVVKPLMSSSGKGQSVVKDASGLEKAWDYAMKGSRGDIRELIVEEFIRFESEITLLTVTQTDGPTLFCPPIGHVQEGGDFRESFQPAPIAPGLLEEAQDMAGKVTRALGGAGIWGVEFFLVRGENGGVYFSELSPRPHDTGMVTLAGTQNLTEFELHLRAFMGWPIPAVRQEKAGACAALLAAVTEEKTPEYRGIGQVLQAGNADLRIFGKPVARPGRRMGVVLCNGRPGADLDALRDEVKGLARKVEIY